ncbi:MAG: M14 family zinc carboxypeptidase [Thermotogota bacterium]|nr:M14 family zinc carboxypeptidase [Thermotogota bacterium]
MKKCTVFILFFILFSFLSAEKMVVRINQPSEDTFRDFWSNNFDIASYKPGEFLDLVVDEQQYEELSQKHNMKIMQIEQQLINNLSSGKDLNHYRNYDEVLAELEALEEDYPEICKLYNIGDTQGKIYAEEGHSFYNDYNHEIWALKVSDNVEMEEDEPGIYYLGVHHSREPLSCEVAMSNLLYIIENYGTDATITDNVDNSQIWFVPLVNPNGHKVVWDETDVWWRKNIRDNNNNHTFDTDYYNGSGDDGVDVNRNYGWEWGLVGASDNINDPTYHGPEAFSEPETMAIKNLMTEHHFVAGISYHTYLW